MIITDKTFDDKIVVAWHRHGIAFLWMQSCVSVCEYVYVRGLACLSKQTIEIAAIEPTEYSMETKKKRTCSMNFVSEVKIAKFNSFYYYGLIPEITNKVRYAQQSHQTNDNEYHKKKRGSVNTQFRHFYLMQKFITKYTHLRTHLPTDITQMIPFVFFHAADFYCYSFFFEKSVPKLPLYITIVSLSFEEKIDFNPFALPHFSQDK